MNDLPPTRFYSWAGDAAGFDQPHTVCTKVQTLTGLPPPGRARRTTVLATFPRYTWFYTTGAFPAVQLRPESEPRWPHEKRSALAARQSLRCRGPGRASPLNVDPPLLPSQLESVRPHRPVHATFGSSTFFCLTSPSVGWAPRSFFLLIQSARLIAM